MALTTHGLPYPLGTDRVADGDDAIKALAQALDPLQRKDVIPAAAGFTVGVSYLWKLGPLCILQATVTRTGADIVAGANGNATDTNMMGPIPTDMIPLDRVYTMSLASSAVGGAGRVNGLANAPTAGFVVLSTLLPSSTLATGAIFDVNAYWMLST